MMESMGDLVLKFTSDAKKHGKGASCTVTCTEAASGRQQDLIQKINLRLFLLFSFLSLMIPLKKLVLRLQNGKYQPAKISVYSW